MNEVRRVLLERTHTHGNFGEHSMTAQSLKDAMRISKNWNSLTSVQRESMEMIAHKIARILNGNQNHKDHYIDILGYAQLALDELKRTDMS